MTRGPLFTFPRALEKEIEKTLLDMFDFNDEAFDNALDQYLAGVPIGSIDDFEEVIDEEMERDQFSPYAFSVILGSILAWENFALRFNQNIVKHDPALTQIQLSVKWSTMLDALETPIRNRATATAKRVVQEVAKKVSFNKEQARDWAAKELAERLANQASSEAGAITSGFIGAEMKATAQALGFQYYIWLTMGDDRVRETHELMDGKICLWGDPNLMIEDDTVVSRPAGAVHLHPGEDYNCRCTAQAIEYNLFPTEPT
jgi:hypothetical protein